MVEKLSISHSENYSVDLLKGNRERIAIIDDCEMVLEIMQFNLTKFNYRADVFSDPLPAINQISKTNYELVISDMGLQGMNGLDVMASLPENIPVLFVSGGFTAAEIDYMENHHLAYLTKPFDRNDLVKIIKKIFDDRKTYQTLKGPNQKLDRQIL